MRDNPTGRFNSETTCVGCGLIKGHRGPCRREQAEGEYAVIDENGEETNATKGSGQASYKEVKRKQLKHGRAQAGVFLLADLGVTKTHSRPHVSNDNPYS